MQSCGYAHANHSDIEYGVNGVDQELESGGATPHGTCEGRGQIVMWVNRTADFCEQHIYMYLWSEKVCARLVFAQN